MAFRRQCPSLDCAIFRTFPYEFVSDTRRNVLGRPFFSCDMLPQPPTTRTSSDTLGRTPSDAIAAARRHPGGNPRANRWFLEVKPHANATSIGWHLWEINLRFATGLPPGWRGGACTASLPSTRLPPWRQHWGISHFPKVVASRNATCLRWYSRGLSTFGRCHLP